MEMKHHPIALTIGLVIFLTWGWKFIVYVCLRPRKLEILLRKEGFKGNRYRLWHGDLKDLSKMTDDALSKTISLSDDLLPRVQPFHHHIVHKYGKKSFMWHGPTPRVIIMDPELIREILFKYRTYRKPVSQLPLFRLLISGIVFYEGDKWAKHRRILDPAFKLEKLKHMLPAIYESCIDIMNKLEKMVTDQKGVEVDMCPYLGNLSADVISRIAFGSSYEEGMKIFQLQQEQTTLAFSVSFSNYIPGWRFVPTKTNRRMKENYNEVVKLIKGIINKRVREMKQGEAGNYKDDFLGILMESNSRMKGGAGITTEEVIEECKLLYNAGQDTTSSLLSFTMVMLANHKDWQSRARQEVFDIIGDNFLDYDKLNHLKVVTMILYEVLRLYPPATLMQRVVSEVTKLGEMTLPAGVEIMLPILLLHHDTEIWGNDAKEFNPERFSEGIIKATQGKASAFFPFSSGPRICLGQHLAMMEAKMAIAMILQRFSFELSPSYVHAPFATVSQHPMLGVKVILHKI